MKIALRGTNPKDLPGTTGSLAGDCRPDSRLAAALFWLLLGGLTLALFLMLVGVVLTLARSGVVVARQSSINDMPRALGALEPGGYFNLGICVLIATPAARVVALVAAFAHKKRWVFCGLSLVVLATLMVGGLVGLRVG